MKNLFSLFIFLFFLVSCKSTQTETNDNTSIRYQESYGSVCCPKDINHDYHIYKFVEDFEKNNDVNIKEVYKVITGKEGEATYYFTLNELSPVLQKKFVTERIASLKVKENRYKDYLNSPENLKELIPNNYLYQTENKDLKQFKDSTFWK
ncbi:hypothetical protein [Aureivirga marina]|uniref:hypothetical protein n=1 Tax=Aureivirga marina TaxID=1182451 RepID=UPI0018CB441B|nr:hypothetical protein [Aureivirga marina]